MINYDTEKLRQYFAGSGSQNSSTSSNLNYNSNITSLIRASNSATTGKTGTFNTSQIIDAICEGPIEGWPTADPLKHIYLDGTAVKSYNNSINSANLRFEFKNGSSDQNPLSQYSLIGAAKAPNYQDELTLNNPVTQQVQIRDDSDGAYPIVEAVAFTFTFPEGVYRFKESGGRDGTSLGFKIEVNRKADGSGSWATRFDWQQQSIELTSAPFDWTFIVEFPPGWATPYDLQNYVNKVDDVVLFRITKTLDDSTNDRAHSKMYLKSYTIYTRNQYSHPYTALAGLTIDSNNFDGSVPKRNYDLKLLKVKVPSNYTVVCDDKTGKVLERNYSGLWDGTFKDGYWTDNPVWCFYDLITNTRYGLGKYIDSTLLNKWRLYEIAKYCDAVVADTRAGKPANSYTFSIPDGLGGVAASAANSLIKEPRFTCNILISNREEAYSVVQRMASLFRGITFFQQGIIEVIQDKPSTPIHLYNNTNVIDGIFSYSSSGTKARHTVAIVKWLDPDDLYSEKLEYVEDYDGIARYGYREIEIDGFGCTSRGQARRLGRHIIITEKFELETVSFKVGMEGGVVTPGSIIKIKDSYRQVYRAAGRVAAATSSSITVDSAVSVPSGSTNVTLWVQTPTAKTEVVDTNTTNTLKPTLNSYSIATVPSVASPRLTLSPTTTLTPIPSPGNMWALSYTEPGDVENTSLFKVLSVVENGPYEYEVTALQHYPDKYDAIEAYAPIPSYNPNPLKLFIPPPTEGHLTYKIDGKNYDITIVWSSDRYISGTKYMVEVINATQSKILISGTTSQKYVYQDAPPDIYYFKIYTLDSASSQKSEPLLLGPLKLKEVMPRNRFETFYQTAFGSTFITHGWKEDILLNNPVKYEIWRTASPQSASTLRSLLGSAHIKSIDVPNNQITLSNFDRLSVWSPGEPLSPYGVEINMLPYTRFKLASGSSPSMMVLNTKEKPNISIGDKIVNTTTNSPAACNVTSIVYSKNSQNRWVSQISIAPSSSGQTSGNFVYPYKGVVGVTLEQKQPSGAIKQKTFKVVTGSSSSTLNVTSPDTFSNVIVGDVVVNRTRRIASKVSNIVSPKSITVSPTITGQASGDIIAYYQASDREARSIYDYSLDYIGPAYGGDSSNVLNYDNPDYMPVPNKSLMMNTTKGTFAEVIDSRLITDGLLNIVTIPSMSPLIQDSDMVVFIDKDEVFTSSISTHIHPTIGIASATTSPRGVTCTGLFTTAVKGDLLVNATRNTSSVILSKISNNQVTLTGFLNSALSIPGQTSGDAVFVVSGASATSFRERLSYTHPTIYTTTSGTTTTNVSIAPSVFSPTPTTSYKLYNMTRNSVRDISSVTASTVGFVDPISDQAVGDKIYVFLPAAVTNTVSTAVDSAFNRANPGDIFYNVTLDEMAYIKDVTALSGARNKKIDRLVLSTPITTVGTQKAGNDFKIVQGMFNSSILDMINNGSDDKLQLESVTNLDIGDKVDIYKYEAVKLATVSGTSFTDTTVSPGCTYRYWMRPISEKVPNIGGIWRPSRNTGDSATALVDGMENYNKSNDNNKTPITPDQVSIVPPGIDVPAGGVNPDSTANINLLWEWVGVPSSLDGFVIYFWSSNSVNDSAEIDQDNDYTKATSYYITRVNPRIKIATVSAVGTTATITTQDPHNFSNGEKIKIFGVKTTGTGSPLMPNVNSTGSFDYFTASSVSASSFQISLVSPSSGTHLTNTGNVSSCNYKYQINNLTANYWYNAWVQAYRVVNTNISENGVLVGTPKKLYSPAP